MLAKDLLKVGRPPIAVGIQALAVQAAPGLVIWLLRDGAWQKHPQVPALPSGERISNVHAVSYAGGYFAITLTRRVENPNASFDDYSFEIVTVNAQTGDISFDVLHYHNYADGFTDQYDNQPYFAGDGSGILVGTEDPNGNATWILDGGPDANSEPKLYRATGYPGAFSRASVDTQGWSASAYAAIGASGDGVWFAATYSGDGLRGYRSSNDGLSWTRLRGPETFELLALGEAANGVSYNRISQTFMVGSSDGHYMSYDDGQTWQLLNQGTGYGGDTIAVPTDVPDGQGGTVTVGRWYCCRYGSTLDVAYSDDNGQTWTSILSLGQFGSSRPAADIFWNKSTNKIYVIGPNYGSSGYIVEIDPAAQTWRQMSAATTEAFREGDAPFARPYE